MKYFRSVEGLAGAILLTALFSCAAMAQKPVYGAKMIYKLQLKSSSKKNVAILRTGTQLQIRLEGFEKPVSIIANGGGTETCRTIISYTDGTSKIILSLPVPTPNMPCQMTPGTLTVEGDKFGLSETENEIVKSTGNDVQLRKAVEARFGKISPPKK